LEIKVAEAVSIVQCQSQVLCTMQSSQRCEIYSIVLQSLGIEVELPITIYCDNVGPIFMAENASATSRTKHVDAQYHYV
jgi:hypothetical protein